MENRNLKVIIISPKEEDKEIISNLLQKYQNQIKEYSFVYSNKARKTIK